MKLKILIPILAGVIVSSTLLDYFLLRDMATLESSNIFLRFLYQNGVEILIAALAFAGGWGFGVRYTLKKMGKL